MEPSLLTIEVISDAICPWCWIGKRQIERARTLLAGKLTLAIRWKPFELNPSMPRDGVPRRVYRQAKFGSLDYSEKLDARVVDAGRAVGLDFHYEKVSWTPNTFDAHRLIWLAGQKGKQEEVVEGLFTAYFHDGRNIGDAQVLIEVGQAAGIDPGKITKMLSSGAGASEVREELERAHDIGIDSVPTITVDGEPLISGAAPANTLAETLLRASSLQRV